MDWPAYNLARQCRKTIPGTDAMITRLLHHYGLRDLCLLLDVSESTIIRLQARGKHRPDLTRLLWTYYAMTFEPHKLSSMFHVLSWGKFARKDEVRKP